MLQHVAARCSMLQCDAMCCSGCSVLQRGLHFIFDAGVLQRVAVCCSVLPNTAVCCSALQCGFISVHTRRLMQVCCSAWQRVVVRGSVL